MNPRFQLTSAGYVDRPDQSLVPRFLQRDERVELGLEVEHTRHEPVMLIGHGSSGTSICAGLIRKYCAVAFGNESQFLIRLARLSQNWGDLSDPQVLRGAVEYMLQERYFQKAQKIYGFHPTADQILSRVQEPTMSGIYQALFSLLAEHQQTARWGDKTPEYMEHLPELAKLFPTAQYILVVRDGRDTALSVMSRYYGPNNLVVAAQEWRETARQGMQFLETLPADRKLVIRYEDMMVNPVETLKTVMDFLGARPCDPQMFERIGPMVREELRANNFNKWKKKMSVREREIFESLAGPELKYYGFETEFSAPRPPSPVQMTLFPWHDRLVRILHPKAFSNNVYRLSMRLRDWWHDRRLK
jgi:hypothetical protein